MLTLIFTVIVGLIFAYLATQNTQGVNLSLLNYSLTNIPLYIVALGSLLIGLLLSSVVHLVNSLYSFFSIHRKDTQIAQSQREVNNLENRIHELEVENAHLKGQKNDFGHQEVIIERSTTSHPSLFERLRHNLFAKA